MPPILTRRLPPPRQPPRFPCHEAYPPAHAAGGLVGAFKYDLSLDTPVLSPIRWRC